MRKPLKRSALERLPAEQQNELHQWLAVEGIIYEQALLRLEQRFNVRTNYTALSGFFQKVCVPRLLAENAPSPQGDRITIEIITHGSESKIIITAPAGSIVHTDGTTGKGAAVS